MMLKYMILCLAVSFLIANNHCLVDNEKAPLWVCGENIYDLNYNTAIGIATKNNLPFKIVKKIAIANAQANLAETIKVNVQSELYMKTTSITHNGKEFIENETIDNIHTIAKEKISTYRVLKIWQSKSYLYVLIGIALRI